MSRVTTVFRLSIYAMVAIASVMLAIAEGAAFPQLLVPPLAVLAYFLVERARRFILPDLIANVLGLVAFAAAGWEFFDENIEGRILSGAHLLIYLSLIVLFQKKSSVQYWWMCALSVLMVAVGAVLTNDETYGAMLLGFMVFSIWTLSVFSLHQAQLQFGRSDGENGDASRAGMNTNAVAQPVRVTNISGPQLAAWLRRPSAASGAIRHDPNERWFSPQFLLTNFGTSLGAIFISAFFFLFIPRLWAGRTEWESVRQEFRPRAISGFTAQVRLGDFGELLSSASKVLEVQVFNNDTGEKLDVEAYTASLGMAEPLFRGTVMGDYKEGTWSAIERKSTSYRELNPEPLDGAVRQDIHMEPIGTDILFGLHPIYGGRIVNHSDEIQAQYLHGVLYRPNRVPVDRAVAYTLYSPRNRIARRVESDARWKTLFGKVPGPELARLSAKAREIAGYDPTNPTQPPARERAERLHAYLRNSGEYSYSLDTTVDDFSVDPVEDFLFSRKKGHCEYFGTALALMLRSVDIPARLVSGFKGGKLNAISGHFEVEQRHAHAWVEALIDKEIVTLDATPEARAESVESFAPSLQTAHDLASFMKGTWSRYVVNMDINQQNSNFYDPVKEWWRQWWSSETGVKTKAIEFLSSTADFLRDPRRWFSVEGAGFTFALLLISVGVYKLVRRSPFLWRLFQMLFRRYDDSSRIRVAFYERFEKLCMSLGMTRKPTETQREFAELAATRILALPPNGQLGDIPARIVRQFYRVRFGEQELGADEAERLDRDLAKLEAAIGSANGRR